MQSVAIAPCLCGQLSVLCKVSRLHFAFMYGSKVVPVTGRSSILPPTSMELAYGLTGLAAVHRKRQGVYLHLFGPQCQSLSPCFLTSMHKVEPKLDQSRYDLLKQNQLSVCTPLTRMNAKLFNISEYIPTIPLGEDHHVDLLHTEDHGHLHEDKQHSEDGSFLLGFPQLDNSQPFTSFLQSGPSAHFGHSCRWRLKSSADINFIAHYV